MSARSCAGAERGILAADSAGLATATLVETQAQPDDGEGRALDRHASRQSGEGLSRHPEMLYRTAFAAVLYELLHASLDRFSRRDSLQRLRLHIRD